MDIAATIAKLTPKGRELMTQVGQQKFSFFDDGIVADSGIWGECIANEMGVSPRSASGILNGTKKLGLWGTTDGEDMDDSMWWYLTELGAAVANELAKADEPVFTETVKVVTAKRGAKWTYLYVDGELIAELRNDQTEAIAFFLAQR